MTAHVMCVRQILGKPPTQSKNKRNIDTRIDHGQQEPKDQRSVNSCQYGRKGTTGQTCEGHQGSRANWYEN